MAVSKQQVNPWEWQNRLGFSQAWRVEGADAVVFVSGQAPISPDGELVGEADFEAQMRQVFENLKTVLTAAGASVDAVVKLTVYLTDISKVREYGRIKSDYFPGPQPASTAVGVTALALPGMMVEVEAVAVV